MDPKVAQETLEQFARFLSDHQGEIIREWLAAVQSDGRLQTSERLTVGELQNHLPKLIENLTSLLRAPAQVASQRNADENARIHGSERFAQGYRLDELLRELARIRAVMIRHTLEFEERTPAFEGVVKRVTLQRLHAFFDDMICDSAAQFVRDQQSGLHKDVDRARLNAKEAREEQREAQEQKTSVQSNLNELKEVDSSRLHLLRTAAHELRNGVNAVWLTAQELQAEAKTQTQRDLTGMLMKSIRSLESLLNDLLDYSVAAGAADSTKGELVIMQELCDELDTAYAAFAETKGLELKTECDPSLLTVESQRSKLVQIAANLLTNALKYTAKGRVRFWVRAVDEATWSLGVEDTGAGMAPQEIDRLFTDFHRAKNTAHLQGTGLGLAIVKRLVDLLGGEIRVHSELDKGSRFEVILPRTLAPPSAAARP